MIVLQYIIYIYVDAEGAVMIIPSQAGSASAGITSSPDAMVYVVENDVMKGMSHWEIPRETTVLYIDKQ